MIGERLTQLRKQKNITQKYLAEKLDLSIETISKYERGAINPSEGIQIQLAKIFDVSLDYLVGLVDFPYPLKRQAFELPRSFPESEIPHLVSYANYLMFMENGDQHIFELFETYQRLEEDQKKMLLAFVKKFSP